MPSRRPDPVRLVLYVAVALAGVVFVLQGLGVPIGRSFMIGDLRWTAIGAVMALAAAVLFVRGIRTS
jgi:predicted membrane channel-forming protein YqfA (hemolysin III family)